MSCSNESFLNHPLKVMKSYLTPELLAVEKYIQNFKESSSFVESSAFGHPRDDKEFTDVTLVCEGD